MKNKLCLIYFAVITVTTVLSGCKSVCSVDYKKVIRNSDIKNQITEIKSSGGQSYIITTDTVLKRMIKIKRIEE